jgi:TfoX/Sxy family transcriptional regulator of competence genes
MAYDEGLAQRIRESVGELPEVGEKRMFGGLAFLHRGNMLVGVMGDDLIARVGPDASDAALALPGARVFDFTGRPMRAWVLVDGAVLEEDTALDGWIDRARAFVDTLPTK